ncbi:putative MULE transposase domain-containing protein [Rosa chinensis]|uniref:Putative MULE transposase domain-containing protein n=1 Tax=Rosa chinensis TaxID=74649 RepID=A0A2P6S941_ROSCH|nr:putative MULE transposase domain-containing protein [Rosa chinensis]
MKKGWTEGCRPIIGVDGCHLKTMHKGQLLTAVGIDGNNGMYPIAWAVVEKETREAWTWFFKFLKDDLCLVNDCSYVFMSDKQKGILEAVKELFPNASHRHCARHLYNNFKGDGNVGQELKDLFWAAARSTTKNHWIKNLDSIHSKSTKAWNFLKDKPAEHWSRSHFKVEPKCDILLNNHCESYNSKILPARKMPILGLLEDMRINSMIRHANRRCAGPRWKSKVGPRIEKNLKKNADRSHEYTPLESSHLRFQVQGKGVVCQSGVNICMMLISKQGHVPAGGGNSVDFHVHMQSLQYSPRVTDQMTLWMSLFH